MGILDKKVKEFAKPTISVKHSREIAFTVTRAELTELNNVISSKVNQNRRERDASWCEARNKIVK